jgi:DnaK suppressor protein
MPKLDITDLTPKSGLPAKERGYPDNYQPAEKEEYMSLKQLAFFRDLLLTWREELSRDSQATVQDLQEHSSIEADPNDQASLEYEQSLELRTRDRERKLINKIDEALDRIRDGSFGYCEETGDPIGIKRLLARPIATLSIEAKRRQEQKETGYAG